MDKRFSQTHYVVEANSFEQLSLWEKYHKTHSWVEDNQGLLLTIGHFHNNPICISISWATVNNKLIMFFEPTSTIVNYNIIDKWLDENCNPMNGSRKARTDAMNFHLAL